MLHKPSPDSTPAVDNRSPIKLRVLLDAIEQSARQRDRSIASIENLIALGTSDGHDPVRLRQAAGVL